MRDAIDRKCWHGVNASLCPACSQEQRDFWEADQLARRSPETIERLRVDFENWTYSLDCSKARGTQKREVRS
jgi:hypothetical protein